MQSSSSETSSSCTASWRSGGGFDVELIEDRPGIIAFRVVGKDAARVFKNEPGGHRWQRIPPTEKKGRVQTSTVTVAVLREPTPTELNIPDKDIEFSTCRSSGSGGQSVNTTNSAVILVHTPTLTRVRCESERSQLQNRATAMAVLRARLLALKEDAQSTSLNASRKNQVGSGMRGDKVRTIRVQDGIVTDHILDVKVPLKEYLRGEFGPIIKG